MQPVPQSISLTQIPHTGFDYGEPFNSLFWGVLVLWSMLLTWLVLRKRQKIAHGINRLAAIFRVARPAATPEPRIMHERVVTPAPSPQPRPTPPVQAETVATAVSPHNEVRTHVRTLVDKELAKSRVDAFPEEFTEDDFGTVDFDGVNPDDSWVPQPKPEPEAKQEKETPAVVRTESFEAPVDVVQRAAEVAATVAAARAAVEQDASAQPPAVEVHYSDTLTLDNSSEVPRLVLSRTAS